MEHLFREEIYDWPSWSAVSRSMDKFRPLIRAIFERESLEGSDRISQLTPGTNAVFRVGDYVLKIFAPVESGINGDAGYELELQSIRRAKGLGIRTPGIVAASNLQDKYVFPYLIMDFIDGEVAGQAILTYNSDQRRRFIQELKFQMALFNTKPDHEIDSSIIRDRAITNDRWAQYPEFVRLQIAAHIGKLDLSDCVYVHGDLNSNNVILNKNGRVYIIDFAETAFAPVWYEYPPILFDLFRGEREAIQAFAAATDPCGLADRIFDALLLHDFGGDYIREIYNRYTGNAVQDMKDMDEIRHIVETLFSS